MFRNVPLRLLIERVQAFLNPLLVRVIPTLQHLRTNALFERIEAIRGVRFNLQYLSIKKANGAIKDNSIVSRVRLSVYDDASAKESYSNKFKTHVRGNPRKLPTTISQSI